MVGCVADNGVVTNPKTRKRFYKPCHFCVETGATSVIVGDFSTGKIHHLFRNIAWYIHIGRIVHRMRLGILLVRPVWWAPRHEQRKGVVRPRVYVPLYKSNCQIRLDLRSPAVKERRPRLILVITPIKITCPAMEGCEIIQTIAFFRWLWASAQMERTHMSCAITMVA